MSAVEYSYRELRHEVGLTEGAVVELKRKGAEAILLTPARRKRRRWKDLRGIKPVRTGKPEWPTHEEIKSIWE